MLGDASPAYTGEDHLLREYDRYARAKYHLTVRWLRAHVQTGDLLYNIGVGSGYFNQLALRLGTRVVGCEPDPAAFELARRAIFEGDCEIVQSTLNSFAHDRERAAFVVMHDVLEHIDDDAAAVQDLRSLVLPTGRIILSVPAFQTLFGQHDVELGHFRRYTKATLRALAEPYFHIRRLRYFGLASIPIVLFFSVFKRQPYPREAVADNLLSKLYGTVCTLESYVDEPVGTSLIAELEPRR